MIYHPELPQQNIGNPIISNPFDLESEPECASSIDTMALILTLKNTEDSTPQKNFGA